MELDKLKFWLKKKSGVPEIPSVDITLYPDRIMVNTFDRIEMGLGVASKKFTFLPAAAGDEEIGRSTRYHLGMCEYDFPNPPDFGSMYKEFLKAAGFKKPKDAYYQAKKVSVVIVEDIVKIYPSINQGSRFNGIKDGNIEIPVNSSDEELGRQIRIAWGRCEGGDDMYIRL